MEFLSPDNKLHCSLKVVILMCVFFHYSDPLPKTVLLAFRARRNLMSNNNQSANIYSVIRQADRAGRLLRESLKLSYNKEKTEIVQVSIVTFITCFK